MYILRYELKKILFTQKAIVYMGIFFILYTGILVITDSPANENVELYRDQYHYYMNELKGPMDEEKENFIIEEAKKIANAQVDLTNLYDAYYDGNIAEDTFNEEANHLRDILKNKDGFEQIYKQYLYVVEKPENRYFMYKNGWSGLLENKPYEGLFILALVLIITNIYCYEYRSNMDDILITTSKGAYTYRFAKFMTGCSLVTLLYIIMLGIKWLYYDIKYGLPYGSFPLQSISMFKESTKILSIGDVFLYIHLLKFLGVLLSTVIIMTISVYFRKQLLTAFISLGAVFLPYSVVTKLHLYFFQPIGFIMGTGYFEGNQYATDEYGNQVDLVFKEISGHTIWAMVGLAILAILIMFILIVIKSSNKLRFLLFGLIFLFGCGNGVPDDVSTPIYNSRYTEVSEIATYEAHYDYSKGGIVYLDKESEEEVLLTREVLDINTVYERYVYGTEDYLYYAKKKVEYSPFIMENTRMREGSNRYSYVIVKVDTHTFREKVIFEKKFNIQRNSIFRNEHNEWSFLSGVSGIFLDKDYIYVISAQGVKQISRRTSVVTTLSEINDNNNIAFDGNYIYYVGDMYILNRYNIQEGIYESVDEVITDRFQLHEDFIEFENKRDENKLYTYNTVSGEIKKINEGL